MDAQRILNWLLPIIGGLAAVAALAGLWPASGTPYPLTTFRGEQVIINARGLYYWDTVSSAAQMQANDLVTLVMGVPLLVISHWLSRRGSLRGRLLLAGTLGFILYTYVTMCVGAQYNQLFLIYTALFSLSLFALVLVITSFDLSTLPNYFSSNLPHGQIAGLLFCTAAFLTIAWLGRIAATFAPNAVPMLENTTSMFIQALDLAIIAPLCVIGGSLLLRRHAVGYLLASIWLGKFLTLGTAVSLMGWNMARMGVAVSAAELFIFPILALAGMGLTATLLKHVKE
ncbi:hypothetical protein [Chloroflexus sp.]|uniref:hypothetical protein n=1 Tax=Chloroflexus sp. TaxID=1904827 RepID=UPI00298F25B0|nr:hypothetical protein [Chloroflexus sp.]MCS6887930.1 hypothetical protein [Chloroflexus sp.]MDW8404211.1 hypothetical protein [Chloroflexus sp.]